MEYISTGLCQLDAIEYHDRTEIQKHLGGIPMYGFAGMRPWTSSIAFAARVGKDFFELYEPWFSDNKVDPYALKFVSETTPYCVMRYDRDMNFDHGYFFTNDWKDADFWRPRGEEMAALIDEGTKGLYVCSPPPPFDPGEFWATLKQLKKTYHFNIMWEPNNAHTTFSDHEPSLELLQWVDLASFNLVEGMAIFGVKTEEELLAFLKGLNKKLILLRLGARGMYAISEAKAWYIPATPLKEGQEVVDVTGCGNTSTAGALVAYCQGDDPLMCGIKASISAYYNLLQFGPYPVFTGQDIKDAAALAEKYYNEHDKLSV